MKLVYYTFLIWCLATTVCFAKKAPKQSYIDSFKNHYINTKFAEVDHNNYPLIINPNSKQSALNNFLQKNKPHFFSENKTVKIVNVKQTSNASYYQYQQFYNNVPVYNSGITVALNNKNEVYSSVYNTYNLNNDVLNTKKPLVPNTSFITSYFKNTTDSIVIKKNEVAVFLNDENATPQYVYVVDFKNFTKNWYHQIVLDSNLNLLYAKDLRTYFSGTETTASAKVYNPDPLTTAGKVYGGKYVDNNDANSTFLNNEQEDVTIPICLTESGTYVLKSEFISIKELENPVTNATEFNTNDLNFGRMADAFENLNIMYHIDEYNNYLISINYKNLVQPIDVDAHAAFGGDNSYFEPDSETPSLLFGEGGVDDAEDADVIIHEYGHAISYQAAPKTNNGTQRQAIDEGFGDYIAASYSKNINDFGWERVFSWDGHNYEWEGRYANTDKTYPNDLVQIHLDGEMWCRALFDIEESIGRDKTHQILLESMHNYQSNITMVDAANLFVKADTLLNNGSNHYVIWKSFFERGFLDYNAFAGKDTIICKNDEIRIGAENLLLPNSTVKWTPNDNINNPNILEPFVSPTQSTIYTLTINIDNIDYTDEVFVQVDTCNSTDFNLLNVNGYLYGEYILLNLPTTVNKQKLKMNLLSNNGQAYIFMPEQISNVSYKAYVGQLPRGIYFLRIVDENLNQNIFRFLKL